MDHGTYQMLKALNDTQEKILETLQQLLVIQTEIRDQQLENDSHDKTTTPEAEGN